MYKLSTWGLLILSGFLLLFPLILEILLGVGVLQAGGSTIEQRKPLYLMMMVVGLVGMFLVIADTISLNRRKS
jgi:hypothetical protein